MIANEPPAIHAESLARVSNSFEFLVRAPLKRVAPLFGPEGERAWAGPAWDPRFIFPIPARDVQGAVFTVHHGASDSLWVTTVFDLALGRMQYVTLIPGAMTAIIDVRLNAEGDQTRATVTYTRTALAASANDHVRHLGRADAASGPEWSEAIRAALNLPK